MSKRTEIWYRQQLNQLVQYLTGEVEGALAQSNRPFLLDSPKEVLSAERILQVLQKLQKSERLDDFTKQVAQGFIHRGNIQNTHETAENLKRQTGLDLADYLQGNQKVAETVRNASLANVQLIKSIQSQYLDKVQTAVTQAMVKGTLTKDLADEIKKIGNITDNRAKFIARDQSAKLNASLTQARHEEMGITHYRWSTSGDERVRDSHADKDGEIFAYAEPPEDTGHPGHDYNCRCVAIPVVDMAEVKQSKGKDLETTNEMEKPKTGKMELSDLFDNSLGGSGNKSFSNLGVVNKEFVKIAKDNTGLDISDWQHSIDESSIRHILKQHGNEKAENNRGQRAVTKVDILLLPLIVKSFDSIEYTGTSDSGNEMFLIKKEIDDEVFCVQELRKRNRKVAVKTMWIRKKKKP